MYGTKIVHEKLGHIAAYCIICRGVMACDAVAVVSVDYIYYFPSGTRRTVDYYRRCASCKFKSSLTTDEIDAVVPDEDGCIEASLARCRPEVRDELNLRRSWDELTRGGKGDSGLRIQLIQEPFALLSHQLERRLSTVQFDRWSVVGAVLVVVVPVLLAARFPGLYLDDGPGIAILVAAGGVFLIATIALVMSDGQRFAREILQPLLVRSLAPMRPSSRELDHAFRVSAANGSELPYMLKFAKVESEIEAHTP